MPAGNHHADPGAQSQRPAGGARKALAAWERNILRRLGRRCVVLGLGNPMRGDDAAGCAVAQGLARRERCGDALVWAQDCASAPENYLGGIERLHPSDVVFADAADFSRPPGSIELFGPCPPGDQPGEFDFQSPSTHSPGLRPALDYLAERCAATCWVLAVQPARLTFGEGLSAPVRGAVEQIVRSLVWAELARHG